jgi:hypothetical protein
MRGMEECSAHLVKTFAVCRRIGVDDTLHHLLPWDIELTIDEPVDEPEEEPEV